MIINIRGTNGSGKSTIVHGLLGSSSEHHIIHGCLGNKYPEAHRLKVKEVSDPVYILGPYGMGKTGPSFKLLPMGVGGCDRIRPYDSIIDLLNKYKTRGHVVFEGVLISDNYGRVGEYLEGQGGAAAVVFLDTPLEICLSNIAGRTKDAKTKHVQRKFEEIQKVRGWFLENGKVPVVDVSMKTGLPEVVKLLRRGHG